MHVAVLGSGDLFGEMPAFDGVGFDLCALESRYALQDISLPIKVSDL